MVRGPTFIRLLARLTDVETPPSSQSLSDRLSQWLEWTHAIALSTALDGTPSAPAEDVPAFGGAQEDECVRARASLVNAIVGARELALSGDRDAGRGAGVDETADYTLFRQRYLALQRSMQATAGQLRGRLRDMLAAKSPALARLAEVDAVMELALSPREQSCWVPCPPCSGGTSIASASGNRRGRVHGWTYSERTCGASCSPNWMFVFNRSTACLQRCAPANWVVMFRNLLYFAVFLVGLAAIGWIGIGYVGSNSLGAAVAGLIGACYLVGALELHRYREATRSLRLAVADLSAPPPSLAAWLEPLHASLRSAVRLRIEGARAAMPAPALTPYLVGLLVLLGMLGTLLGMMATLRGTGIALESATDLQAIRGSLAAPVKGLGFAFGTSIAGVASSAMLGLLSALCRRERLEAVQLLDVKIATTLRIHSQAHQREEAFKLLQQQAESMPALVDRLQAMMAVIEQNRSRRQ